MTAVLLRFNRCGMIEESSAGVRHNRLSLYCKCISIFSLYSLSLMTHEGILGLYKYCSRSMDAAFVVHRFCLGENNIRALEYWTPRYEHIWSAYHRQLTDSFPPPYHRRARLFDSTLFSFSRSSEAFHLIQSRPLSRSPEPVCEGYCSRLAGTNRTPCRRA